MENKEEQTVTMEDKKGKTVSTDASPPTIKYRGIKAMPFILGNETFEKLGAIGTITNLLIYLTTVFNLKNITAATVLSIFDGTSNLAPLIGAFLSDTYFGRYKTLAFSSVCSLLGMIVLTLTAAISKLHPPYCSAGEVGKCVGPSPWQLAFLLIGFGFLVIGAGGIRPCNLAFGADQFNPNTESGKRDVSSYFNWYYFSFTFSMMISATFIVYVQSNVSWPIGLGIPACLMFISCALFFLGSRIYVKVKPEGSPLTSVVQVLVAAMRKRKLKLPADDPAPSLFNYVPPNSIISKLPITDQFRFLNKSAIKTSEDQINASGSAASPWKLCSIQQVEEVKCVVRVIPIWASAIIYHIAVHQQRSFCVLQALQSDRSLGNRGFKVPAGSYIVFQMLTLTLWIPIYDRIVVPSLRKLTGKEGGLTLLQRMGIGLLLSALAMLAAALVEERRRNTALTRPTLGVTSKGGSISSMSAFWLIPQLALTGLAEGFNSIGQMEFYYQQLPENMRSIAGAFYFCGMAGASYISGFLISIVHHTTKGSKTGDWLPEDLNTGKLDYYYYLIAALGVLNFGYFLVCAIWYRYKGDGESKLELSMETKKSDKYFV